MSNGIESMAEYFRETKLISRGISQERLSRRRSRIIRREDRRKLFSYALVSVGISGFLISGLYFLGNDIIPQTANTVMRWIYGEDTESIKYAPTEGLGKSRER